MGMIAAEAISEILIRLYHRMLDLLLTSYQAIWSSRRWMIGSGSGLAMVGSIVANSRTYQY